MGSTELKGEELLRRRQMAENLYSDGAFKLAYDAASQVLSCAPGYLGARLLRVRAAGALGRLDEVAEECAELLGDVTLPDEQRPIVGAVLVSIVGLDAVWATYAKQPSFGLAEFLLKSDEAETELATEERVGLLRRIWAVARKRCDEHSREQIRGACVRAGMPLVAARTERPLEERILTLRFLVTELVPEMVEGWVGLGEFLYQTGELSEARDCFERVAQLDPGNEAAAEGLLRLEYAEDLEIELENGATVCLTGSDAMRTRFNQHMSTSEAYMDDHRPDDAEAELRKILAVDPNWAPAHHAMGLISCYRGEPQLALYWLEIALELDPENPLCHAHLGQALNRLGRVEEATERLEEALRLDPDCEAAHIGMSQLDPGGTGDCPTDVDRLLAEATVAVRYGESDHARLLLDEVFALDPGCNEALQLLANLK